MSKRSALGRRLHNLSQDSQEGDVALWKSIHPGEIGKHSMTARSKRSVALMGATLVMVTACSESPDESASVDVNKYSGDSACDLLPGEKLNQSGITEPCRPMDTSIGLPGCEWSGDALVPLVISLGQELSELVKADTEDKVSESGNIGGFAAVTNWSPDTRACKVYVETLRHRTFKFMWGILSHAKCCATWEKTWLLQRWNV